MGDDLHGLKDDMTAFIAGHGLGRFQAYISDDMAGVVWDAADNPESWKDFVELAKHSGAAFLTMSEDVLEGGDIDYLLDRLQNNTTPLDEEIEEARMLRTHTGKLGYLQLGFPHQGTMFLWETSAPWYDRYQMLLEASDDFTPIFLDERNEDERT